MRDLKLKLKSSTEEVWCVELVTDWSRSCPGSTKVEGSLNFSCSVTQNEGTT